MCTVLLQVTCAGVAVLSVVSWYQYAFDMFQGEGVRFKNPPHKSNPGGVTSIRSPSQTVKHGAVKPWLVSVAAQKSVSGNGISKDAV